MKKKHVIPMVETVWGASAINWDNMPKLKIDIHTWEDSGYSPVTEASVCYDHDHLYVYFRVYENSITVRHFDFNGDVYKDSCVEFFIDPKPESGKGYFNFEMNAAGNMLLGFGKDRHNRRLLHEIKPDLFHICASAGNQPPECFQGPYWTACYEIPRSLLEKYSGTLEFKPGLQMEGNFYKCGDETGAVHFISWNKITSKVPDFHRPEHFGSLTFG